MVERKLTDPDLQALDAIWPIGKQLVISDGGIVVIAGAYKGRYMHYVAECYPKANLILGFEPQYQPAEEAFRRTYKYDNCIVSPFAIGTCSDLQKLMGRYGTDGCSFLSGDGTTYLVPIVEFSQAMENLGVEQIDCFICNMEGYEYELIPYLFQTYWNEKIQSLALQFHPEFANREETIRILLNSYYGQAISSPGWEYWRKQ